MGRGSVLLAVAVEREGRTGRSLQEEGRKEVLAGWCTVLSTVCKRKGAGRLAVLRCVCKEGMHWTSRVLREGWCVPRVQGDHVASGAEAVRERSAADMGGTGFCLDEGSAGEIIHTTDANFGAGCDRFKRCELMQFSVR